jgi:hypothetical protein
MDRRAAFFLLAAAACGALVLAAPETLRWVPRGLSATYLVLAALSFADSWSRRHAGPAVRPVRPDAHADDQPKRPVT